jgi:hypothetical protein
LYESLREAAEASDRPLETVLVESLTTLFTPPPASANIATLLATLPDYPNVQLWAVVYRRLSWTQSLRELSAKGQQGALTPTEQAELEQLLEWVDRDMLLRSEALLLLKQRGQDVNAYLKLSI